jgi:hypothetical protein
VEPDVEPGQHLAVRDLERDRQRGQPERGHPDAPPLGCGRLGQARQQIGEATRGAVDQHRADRREEQRDEVPARHLRGAMAAEHRHAVVDPERQRQQRRGDLRRLAAAIPAGRARDDELPELDRDSGAEPERAQQARAQEQQPEPFQRPQPADAAYDRGQRIAEPDEGAADQPAERPEPARDPHAGATGRGDACIGAHVRIHSAYPVSAP